MARELGPGLTFAVRQYLGLTTIGSIDVDKAGRAKRRKERKRAERAEHRRKNGAVTRAEYEANSDVRREPWKAQSKSRATYYRHRKSSETPSETGACTPKRGKVLLSTDLSHNESHARPWHVLGISRATYYRRQKSHAVQSLFVPAHLFVPSPQERTVVAGAG
jgi:hypothetical protein